MTHINNKGEFVSDKYVIFHVGEIEGLKLEKTETGWHNDKSSFSNDLHRCAYGYSQALLDIKKSHCSENKIVLSFQDKEAREALKLFAELTPDKELAEDILQVLKNYENGSPKRQTS